MRLTDLEIKTIQKTIKSIDFLKPPYSLFIFGSRTNDQKRGGDIDLLLLVTAEQVNFVSKQKHILLTQLKIALGDQRIDLSIRTQEQIKNDPLFSQIQSELIRLL